MAWCLMTPTNGKRCRKLFNAHRDDSDFHIAQWNIRKKVSTDGLCQKTIPKVIKALHSGKFALFQTEPNANEGDVIRASADYCPDTPTSILCLDFDCYASPCTASSCIQQRFDLVRRELPLLLDGVAAVVQLSAKAGLEWHWDKKNKKDVSQRLSMRVFIIADEALTLDSWWKLLEPHARIKPGSEFYEDKGYYFDKACFRPTQPLWLGIPEDNNTARNDLDLAELLSVDGELLNTQRLRDNTPDTPKPNVTKIDSARYKVGSNANARSLAWNLNYETMLPVLNDLDLDGKSIRNDLLTEIFRRVAHTSIQDLEEVAQAIIKHYPNLWDADWNNDEEKATTNLTRRAELAKEYVQRLYLGTDGAVRRDNAWMVHELASRDLPPDVLTNLPDRCEAVVMVDCGGGKTEAIKSIRDDAWKQGKSVLYLAPYQINVYGIADGEKVTTYHTFGTEAKNKRDYSKQDHPQQSWCWKSVNQIAPGHRDFDIVVFDECIEALREWKKTAYYDDCWSVIEEILKNARKIVWLDADFTDEFGLALVSSITANQDRKRYLIESPHSYAEGMQYHLFRNLNDIVFQTIEAINSGQRVVINVDWANWNSDTKEWSGALDAFHALIKHFCPGKKGLSFDSHDCPPELRENFGSFMNRVVTDGFDYIILSPLCPKGASYLPDDVRDDFDLEVSILKARHSDAYKAYQTSRRCRRTAEHFIYLNSSIDPAADASYWEKARELGLHNRMLTTAELNFALINIEEARRKSNPFDQLLVKLWKVSADVHPWDFSDVENADIANMSKQWAKFKKLMKAEHESEIEELDRCLRSWVFADESKDGNTEYRHFGEGDDISPGEIKTLLKRYRSIKGFRYQTMLETYLSTPQQREAWSLGNAARTKQMRKQIGATLDALDNSINVSLDSELTIIRFLLNASQDKLRINTEKIDSKYTLSLVNQYFRELKQAGIPPNASAKHDIVAAIKWLARIIDCEVIEDPGEKKIRWAACFNEAQQRFPGRYPRGLQFNQASIRMVQDIEGLISRNKEPSEAQMEWYETRANVITIVKPKYVSALLLDPCRRYLLPKADDNFIDSILGRHLSFDNQSGEQIYDI